MCYTAILVPIFNVNIPCTISHEYVVQGASIRWVDTHDVHIVGMCSVYEYINTICLHTFNTCMHTITGEFMYYTHTLGSYRKNWGARPSPTEVRRVLTSAASEARYESVFSPPSATPILPSQDIQKVIRNNFPSLRSGLCFSSAQDRLSICQRCPEYRNNVCEVCGCNVKLKVRTPFARCPMGYW